MAYVHGATYLLETAFDPRLDSLSWMGQTASLVGTSAFPKLTGAPYKRHVELGEGTHTIIMEKNRMNLFREVQLFLDEQHVNDK